MTETINIAVIGCGQMGMHHARVYRHMPGVKLLAICEADKQRRDAASTELGCKGYADMEEMFSAHPEINGVSICMPDNKHLEAVEKAAAHKKHILLEKPIASRLDEGKTILDLVKNYDRVFTVGHLLRYDPRFFGLKEAIDSGELGEIIHISCRRNSPITGPRRYIGQSDLSMHVMIHDIDIMNWFLNCPPVKVFARARSVLLKEHKMNDVIYAIITYENGAIVNMEASWVLPENSPTLIDDQVEVVGTRAAAYIDACDKGLRFVGGEKGADYPDTRHWPYVNGSPGGDLFAEISGFIAAIGSGTKPLCSALDAYKALVVVEAIENSIAAGCEVTITTQ